jgi:hypothetical protein
MRLLNRRRRPSAALPALTLAGCLAVTALAGCAVVHTPAPHAHPSGAASSGTAGTGTVAVTPSSSGTPEQRAVADAELMLKAFAPPAGAREVPGSPVPGSVMSRSPATPTPSDDDVVTKTSWWLAPGDPQQVLAWEKAHIPSLYRYFGGGTTGFGIWNDVFSIPAVPGLFDTRELAVSTTSAGGGRTAIRVDALVDWIPARHAGDTVPATARTAKLVETRTGLRGTPPKQATTVIGTATVTDPAQVAALATYLNGLAADPPGGTWSCPMSTGGLTVTFSAQPGGPALATASAGLGGCAFLSYSMPGQPSAALGGGGAGENLLDEVNHVTGLHWKTPT